MLLGAGSGRISAITEHLDPVISDELPDHWCRRTSPEPQTAWRRCAVDVHIPRTWYGVSSEAEDSPVGSFEGVQHPLWIVIARSGRRIPKPARVRSAVGPLSVVQHSVPLESKHQD